MLNRRLILCQKHTISVRHQSKCIVLGGDRQRVDLDDQVILDDKPQDEILEVSEALDKLASSDPQCAEIVKLKYFAGLTIPEIGELMGIPARTVDRRWAYARAWLHQELAK